MKDNFSDHAADYAKYRPVYPQALYDYLFSLVDSKDYAWDVATGNGQVAIQLAQVFSKVLATDLSEKQLQQASLSANIEYRVQTAEEDFDESRQFDLITVAQAIHWFDFESFYKQVYQHLKPNGILAVIGYSVLKSQGELDSVIQHFYKEIIDAYWDEERKYLDEGYLTIPFPFEELQVPHFEMEIIWSQDQFLNYLNTWSAVKHHQKQHNSNPVELIRKQVEANWGDTEKRSFYFPLLVRIGKLSKPKIPT